VLVSYDQETTQFFRWSVSYTTEALSDLIHRRTGIDFGAIADLIPLERGTSGRITRLKVVGSKKTMVIGKELLIRKSLSESHLYSSAFGVDKTSEGFLLTGAGWGHGVGFCQIGAAVMAATGYDYRTILSHYFRESQLIKQY
jgi:SpoIID/LytB domain protein